MIKVRLHQLRTSALKQQQQQWHLPVGAAQQGGRFLGRRCDVLHTLMFLICRLPSSCRDMRGSFPRRLTPSFSQLTEGMGSPDAWHLSRATLSAPSVWLDGPWRMMGGGLSVSTEGQSDNKKQ